MGSGPGDHPGVTIIELVDDVLATNEEAIAAALVNKASFLFTYVQNDVTFAVFASKY